MGNRKTLLLIDGSQVLMFLTQKILERADYSVYCARGSAEAHELLMDITPDAIILGKELADGDGIDFCRELRKISSIPIMLLSGDKEDELPALQVGANDFLKKPYDHDILIARIGVLASKGVIKLCVPGDLNGEYAVASHEIMTDPVQKQPTQTEAASQASAIDINKKPVGRRRYYAAAGFVLLAVFLGAIMLQLYGDRLHSVEIPDEQPPLAEFPLPIDKDARSYADLEQKNKNSVICDVAVAADTVNLSMLLLNPVANSCYVTFEIILADGESLYTSDLVMPGMCIESVTLSRGLEKGKHHAVLRIRSYSADSFAEVGVTENSFYITAN